MKSSSRDTSRSFSGRQKRQRQMRACSLKPGSNRDTIRTFLRVDSLLSVQEKLYSTKLYSHTATRSTLTQRRYILKLEPFTANQSLRMLSTYSENIIGFAPRLSSQETRMGRPQLLVARGSPLDPRKLYIKNLVKPLSIIQDSPHLLQSPCTSLPTYVTDDQDRIISDLEDISGQHQASRGMSPGGGVVAATAINYLQEKDDSLMYATYASWEAAVEKSCQTDTFTCRRIMLTHQELSRSLVPMGLSTRTNFKGADIAFNALDIRIEGGSSPLPQSKAAETATY